VRDGARSVPPILGAGVREHEEFRGGTRRRGAGQRRVQNVELSQRADVDRRRRQSQAERVPAHGDLIVVAIINGNVTGAYLTGRARFFVDRR